MNRLFAAMALGLLASACGGSSGTSSPTPPPTTTNPCVAAAVDEEDQAEIPLEDRAAARLLKTNVLDGSPRWRVLDALWTHSQYLERGEARTPSVARLGTRAALSRAATERGRRALPNRQFGTLNEVPTKPI